MTGQTFVRWRAGEPREGRVFPPLDPSHPAAAESCAVCESLLGDGSPVQLLAIGPLTPAAHQEHRAGRWYSALALLFHAACLGTEVSA